MKVIHRPRGLEFNPRGNGHIEREREIAIYKRAWVIFPRLNPPSSKQKKQAGGKLLALEKGERRESV